MLLPLKGIERLRGFASTSRGNSILRRKRNLKPHIMAHTILKPPKNNCVLRARDGAENSRQRSRILQPQRTPAPLPSAYPRIIKIFTTCTLQSVFANISQTIFDSFPGCAISVTCIARIRMPPELLHKEDSWICTTYDPAPKKRLERPSTSTKIYKNNGYI